MDFIQAWKKAKGKKIGRPIGQIIYTGSYGSITNFLAQSPFFLSENDWRADDWEIVKRKVVLTGVEIDNEMGSPRLNSSNEVAFADDSYGIINYETGMTWRMTLEEE